MVYLLLFSGKSIKNAYLKEANSVTLPSLAI